MVTPPASPVRRSARSQRPPSNDACRLPGEVFLPRRRCVGAARHPADACGGRRTSGEKGGTRGGLVAQGAASASGGNMARSERDREKGVGSFTKGAGSWVNLRCAVRRCVCKVAGGRRSFFLPRSCRFLMIYVCAKPALPCKDVRKDEARDKVRAEIAMSKKLEADEAKMEYSTKDAGT